MKVKINRSCSQTFSYPSASSVSSSQRIFIAPSTAPTVLSASDFWLYIFVFVLKIAHEGSNYFKGCCLSFQDCVTAFEFAFVPLKRKDFVLPVVGRLILS